MKVDYLAIVVKYIINLLCHRMTFQAAGPQNHLVGWFSILWLCKPSINTAWYVGNFLAAAPLGFTRSSLSFECNNTDETCSCQWNLEPTGKWKWRWMKRINRSHYINLYGNRAIWQQICAHNYCDRDRKYQELCFIIQLKWFSARLWLTEYVKVQNAEEYATAQHCMQIIWLLIWRD